MESSLNSSSLEPTNSGLKSIFKKPTDICQTFEVSLNESVTAAQSNKSELDLDATPGIPKILPFKKSRKSVQQHFNVSSDGNFINNDSEQSVTLSKPQSVFAKKNKSFVDYFNVSFNETEANSEPELLGKSDDEFSTVHDKTNPFKKKNNSQSEILLRAESSVQTSPDKGDILGVDLEESQKNFTCDIENEADSTTFRTKENPFKKSNKRTNESLTQMRLSITEEKSLKSKSADTVDKSIATNDSKLNEQADSSTTKSNVDQFREKTSLQNGDLVTSITEERSNKSEMENVSHTEQMQLSQNASLGKSISNLANSVSYLQESSVNDENLNNWMSDHSDEEMPLPRVPSIITTNVSHCKDKVASPSCPAPETNPLSVWEQKFEEIVSNTEKKVKEAKTKMNISSSLKPKELKKSDQNVEKPLKNLNKYKAPKLVRPAPFATKKLYDYIIKKLEPKYGIDTMIEAENLVLSISDTVKKISRRKTHQKKLIQNIKKEMAKAGLIETTMDFYEFVIRFLPYSFRVKVVPCLQPMSNVVYPPKDVMNPFDKIL